ncbi:MAG: helix-turn-helix transcriptional regulator [Oscillospiraceae bacterium]|nr:helix-turn-helix transcriptional regulator [Oscillospiraceae bacterium]
MKKYRLKELRESELLSQKEVATAIYCSQRAYCYYEAEEHDIPTQTLIRLADFYNVSVDYILRRTDNPKLNK